MKTVTFYSYKGGVGRTLALTNVAEYLALFQKKVCILDFDLEAPGVNYKLEEKIKKEIPLQQGIVDYMHEFFIKSKQTALPDSLKEYIINIEFPKNQKKEDIIYIPAGNPVKSSYWKQVYELDWQDFFYQGKRYGVPFFIELKERIKQELKPDFLLIDSRTGVSNILHITTSVLGEQVIVLGANNKENLDGSALVMESLSKKENHVLDRELQLEFVLTRIPYPKNKVEENREKRRLETVQTYLNEKISKGFKKEILVIHSDRELEWKEETRITGDRRIPITQDYLRLFHKITDGLLKEADEERYQTLQAAEKFYNQSFYTDDINEKIELLTKAIELNPFNENAYGNRGNIFYKQGKYELAIEDYNKTIELDSENAIFYNNRGYIFDEQGKYDLAIKDYNKAIELDSENAIAYNNRGSVFDEQGKYDLAMADYTKAIELDSEDADTYNNRGNIFYKQGKYELAMADYTKSIELDSENAILYNNRGTIFTKQGKYELAIEDYNKAIELDSENAIFYNNRGNTFRKMKKYSKALEDIKQALSIDSKDGYAYSTLAEIHSDLGNEEEFYKNIELAMKYDYPVIEKLDKEIYEKYKDKTRFKNLLTKYNPK